MIGLGLPVSGVFVGTKLFREVCFVPEAGVKSFCSSPESSKIALNNTTTISVESTSSGKVREDMETIGE
jgi:hypothetical protein